GLRFGWNADIDYTMDVSFVTRKVIALWSLLILHPEVLYILYTKKSVMHSSLRYAYISEQISLIINELVFSILTRPYPLFPFSGLHCDGPLARGEMPKTDLMFLVGFSVVVDVPSFVFLIMRMHTATATAAGSSIRLSNAAQVIVMVVTTSLMLLNVITFGSLARDATYYDKMLQIPEISALSSRGGTNVLFGVPGDLGVFKIEFYILVATICICLPLPSFLTAHARCLIANSRSAISERAQQAQERLSRVLFIQILEFVVFYLLPLVLVFTLMYIDVRHWPDWLMAFLRPL
ncbi:hypothetical protein PMAYCL1PPCAC_11450, partial [Pristionchus mayeri]